MFITGTEVVKQLYDAPTPMKLDRNLIEVDLTFTNPTVSLAFLSIVSCSRRMTPLQVARLVYMYGEGSWLVSRGGLGTRPELGVLMVESEKVKNGLAACVRDFEAMHGIRLHVTNQVVGNRSDLPAEWLSGILAFSFECELVRSCGWVQIGKDLDALTMLEAVSVPKAQCEKQTRNIQMVSIGGTDEKPFELRIKSNIHKYYPLDASEIPTRGGINVVVLPNFTDAVCTGPATINDLPSEMRNPEDFKRYWWTQHGFKLPDEALSRLVKITINDHISLVYPLTCIWKIQPCFVPSYTKLYESSMNARIKSATEWVRGVWQYACGLNMQMISGDHSTSVASRDETSAPYKRARNG